MTTRFLASSKTASRRLQGKRTAPAIALIGALAIVGALSFPTTADARLGGGGSFGSRGSRTYSMPSATPTAPRASPFQRSATPNGGYGNPGFAGAPRSGGLFGGGLGRGLIGGFLGAGLFGMLFGHGLFGGLGGGMSLIGLILQLGLLFLAVRFIMAFFANRRQTSGSGGNSSFFGQAPSSGSAMGFGGSQQQQAPQGTPISIGPQDYEAFERRLTESQAAYSNGDVGALGRIATPEMIGNFEQELRDNERQGVVNRISDVHLLSGDLSEAWNEAGSDYATVAMRFSLIDSTVEKASGRVVAGDAHRAQEVTEVWTFRRPSGSGTQAWALAGIQQA